MAKRAKPGSAARVSAERRLSTLVRIYKKDVLWLIYSFLFHSRAFIERVKRARYRANYRRDCPRLRIRSELPWSKVARALRAYERQERAERRAKLVKRAAHTQRWYAFLVSAALARLP